MKHEEDYKEFISLLESQNQSYDYGLIKKAFEYCVNMHEGQLRRSKEEYYHHPLSVAKIVASFGLDTEAVCAALLHDTVEDTSATYEDIRNMFGREVADLVDGVTKIGKLSFVSKEEQQAENLRKMLIAMGKDIRVILVKLADRLHNMRTIDAMPEEKQLEKSIETLEVYAPIAHRLGIRAVKEELEDLAIKHLDPVGYKEIENLLQVNSSLRLQILNDIKARIEQRLKEDMPDVKMDFQARVKSIHGIYRKMFIQGKSFEEIYDIYAIRVITDNISNCYNILGHMHDMFQPIPNRFKDYISTPKPNMYQSLHTTVISKEGIPFEIQIRTFEMHKTAEYGIAAHWKYKEGVKDNDAQMEERLAWIRQILEEQSETEDASEIFRSLKVDLAQDNVFAVTPKGKVISLPAGATVIDFAFAIHSQVGEKMVGAKVDGRIVPINHVINTGEVIEILTTNQPGHGPSRDWINIAVTNRTKTKIRQWFKKEKRAENTATGKSEVEKEFKRNGIVLDEDEMTRFLENIAKRQHFSSIEDFYAAIGYGGITLSSLMHKIKDDYSKIVNVKKEPEFFEFKEDTSKNSSDVIVEGIDNCLIKFAKCCAPLPGDRIIGFITRGHGVSIHKRDCINVPENIEAAQEPGRWIPAYWSGNKGKNFAATLMVSSVYRHDIMADVTTVLYDMHIPLINLNASTGKDGNCTILLTVSTEGVEHLKSIISHLSKISGVYSVERLTQEAKK